MAALFDPLRVRSHTFRTRGWVPPMSQYSAPAGRPVAWHHRHYASLAMGAGCVIVEATAVSSVGRVTPEDLVLDSASSLDDYACLAQIIAQEGATPGIQLSHAGRKASRSSPWKGDLALTESEGGWERLAPSPSSFSDKVPVPREMSRSEVRRSIEEFAHSAQLAYRAGFRFIEVHGGHGRLVHSFLSPLSNMRTDEYGLAADGGTRYACEVADAIRLSVGPEAILAFRLSCVDWIDDGVTIEDTVRLANLLGQAGVDMIDCSSGGIVTPLKKETFPGYQVPFASAIRRGSNLLTAAVGEITTIEQADQIIGSGSADVVLFGRRALADPMYLAREAMRGSREEIVPRPYQRAIRSMNNRDAYLPPEL